MTTISDITYLSQDKKEEKIQKLRDYAKKLSDKDLLTHMGMANFSVWCILTHYGVYYHESRDFIGFANLMRTDIEIKICMRSQVRILREYWPDSHKSSPHARKCRERLRTELQLWDYEDRPKGARNGGKEHFVYTPPLMTKVDLFGLIMLFQVCLQELAERDHYRERLLPYSKGKTMPDIVPEHGGYVMQKAYDLMNFYFSDTVEDYEQTTEYFLNHPETEEYQEIEETDFIAGSYHLFLNVYEALVVEPYQYAVRIFQKTKKAVVKIQEDLIGVYTEDQLRAIPF